MGLDRIRLVSGLREVLRGSSTESKLPDFHLQTLAEGTSTAVLGIQFTNLKKSKWKNEKKGTDKVIVKWYHREPISDDEPIYVGDNQIDVSYIREQRNIENVREIVRGSFLPEIYGFSNNSRLIVMEHLGKKTRNEKLLREAAKLDYTGSDDLPTSLEHILINTIDKLALFNGICHARESEFTQRHNYLQEANSRRWTGAYTERLRRLHRYMYNHDSKVDIDAKLSEIQEQAQLFEKEKQYYHGDFNLLQVIGEKMVDFERFGLYGLGRDFATLCLIAGLENSAAIYASKQFFPLFDRYVASVATAKKKNDINLARAEIRVLSENSPDELHTRAVKEGGGPEQYATIRLGVFYHALNNLVRMGAAFHRMYEYSEKYNGDGNKRELDRRLESVYRGIDTIFSVSGSKSFFEEAPDGKLKQDFFFQYHNLLSDLKLPISR